MVIFVKVMEIMKMHLTGMEKGLLICRMRFE